MVCIPTREEPNMSVIGKMTRSKDKVLKPGLRDQSTKASMRKDKRKG